MRTSVTMQWNASQLSLVLRKCSAVSKQVTLRCLRVKKSCSESRTAASSSMRATWMRSTIVVLRRDGKREMHERAARIAREPTLPAMGFYDRPAKRQPYAQALGLLRCERQERIVHKARGESRAVVRHP